MFTKVLICFSGGLVWGVISWIFQIPVQWVTVGILGVFILCAVVIELTLKEAEENQKK